MPEENIAKIMQEMLKANAEAARKLLANAAQHRSAAANELLAAQQELQEILSQKDLLYQQFLEKHIARVQTDLERQVKRRLAMDLLDQGKSPEDIVQLLDLDDETADMLADRALNNPYTKIEEIIMAHTLKVTYHSQGRGGDIVMNWRGQECRFWYEFAGGEALVYIDVPDADRWEAQTNIPLALRDQLLEQLAKSVVRDQAPGHQYRIEPAAIVIL